MNGSVLAYLVFGLGLVALFAAIVAHFYSRRRKTEVEEAKFTMLDDD